MKTHKLSFALVAALLALPLSAVAQNAEEEESPFSWNAAITSDYVFRGVSQTDEEPALQLGFDFSFGSGFYVGAWGSNVDFGSGGPDIEIDTYIGWNYDLSDDWNFDVALNRYNYFGEDDDFGDGDYNELLATLSYAETYNFNFGYTNDVYNLGESAFWYAVDGGWDIGNGFSLGAGVGLNTFDSSTGYQDYVDWTLSLGRDFGPVSAALSYHGTDSDGEDNFGDIADDRFVLTFSIGG
jgi:uncharacterized protein (TIGR02001 family)